MQVKEAREIARQWVAEEAGHLPGFLGAFCHGSINWMADKDEVPTDSDFDVLLVFAEPHAPPKPGKLRYRGLLLEISLLHEAQIASAEIILGTHYLAGSFQSAKGILADPGGRLRELQAEVGPNYADRHRVSARCEMALKTLDNFRNALSETQPVHDQVASVVFAAGVTTHVLLVAGLRNPTVRRRYAEAKELLEAYPIPGLYEELLTLAGFAHLTRSDVEGHLAALANAYDTASAVLKTPYRFAADLTESSRAIPIDGSRRLIEQGLHREALFWIAAVYCRCRHVLSIDAPLEVQARHEPGFQRLIADLGMATYADRQRRAEQIGLFLPRLREAADSIAKRCSKPGA